MVFSKHWMSSGSRFLHTHFRARRFLSHASWFIFTAQYRECRLRRPRFPCAAPGSPSTSRLPGTRRRAASEWIDGLKTKLPVDEDGNYVNVMDRVGESSVRQAYGPNYVRLQQIKARYDPENLFSLNQNIRPAS